MDADKVRAVDPANDPTRCGHYGHYNTRGELCGRHRIAGTQSCRRHAGKTAVKAKAEGQVRLELVRWGTDDSYVDPGEQFLRLISQSARRCELYASLLESEYMDKKVAALVGVHYVTARDEDSEDAGDSPKAVASGAYIRGLAELEARERRFCADLCAKAIAAGLEARKVQLAERMGASVVQAISLALGRLGLDVADGAVRGAVSAAMLELGA